MSGAYFDAVRQGLSGVLRLLEQIAFPLALFLGLLVAALLLAYAMKGSELKVDWAALKKSGARTVGFMGVGLLVVCLWAGLKQVRSIERDAIDWKASAEASDNPMPNVPPVDQYGPVAAIMVEKTYSRTISLPPDMVQRIGAEGVAVLSPYLVDPTAQNVLRLVDSFKRVGQDVTFTRELTREDESPISFDSCDITVKFNRQQKNAFEADFKATYAFTNPSNAPIKGRFLFAAPDEGGTIQNLSVKVANDTVAEPNDDGDYEWKGTIGPGETRKATVSYKASGGKTWSYDLGSNRRRVRSFTLSATSDGPIQFLKNSIQPTTRSGNSATWKLSDVVTSQRLSIRFPEDVRERESYLQALATLPAVMVLFGLAIVVMGFRMGSPVASPQLGFALLLFGLSLGASAVLANYVPHLAAIVLMPALGAFLGSWVVGWRNIVVLLPVALLPAASMSPNQTGLWGILLVTLALVAFAGAPRLFLSKPTGTH